MKLNQLVDPGSVKDRKRVGRGIGSGKGKTSGRGHKGQKARQGHHITGFEGGQMPLWMRLPKRGFTRTLKINYATLTLGKLQKHIEAGQINASDITEETLVSSGIIKNKRDGIKLLERGEFTTAITAIVTAVSEGAKSSIEKAGGSVKIIEKKKYSQPSKKKKAKAA